VIRGFVTSPEYLFDHRCGASLARVLNTDLLAGAVSSAQLND